MNNFWDESRGIFDDIYRDEQGNMQFDGHLGYLNFWPFFLNVLDPQDEKFKLTVQTLLDKDSGMWTPYGIRSMSNKDPFYE